ncbi:putative LLM family oxidoreductase [Anseongella ginsenosidimutans]|uniref:Putative LLM family oxidoreductase n=1 Tax=Anseongella ginsenosidimutans TaxID=496056 RepID=A0A4V6NZ41_9SPHI|nr:LLM class flavin-dependent oxidoreductase [Anseongella ginsenosidimutans]QEC53431.1 LLM class flavin-dependent oxidoreductase [Anseongella ginsenosidimutans]TCS88322.1 putative LLM family oxidoreductase [Anseongella ginsenosidimutans]
MEFGIGMFGDLAYSGQSGKFRPAEQRLAEMVEEIKLADQLGLDVVALGEHHRADYAIASTEVMLAALASVTKNIKLASGVTVLSSADPVKVYQDYATLDLLSSGRAEIIAGRGSFIESFPLYGYRLEDYDALFSEKLELLLTVNRDKTVSWRGKFRQALQEQEIYPRALGGRQIPVWIAVGGTPASIRRAGILGLPMMLAIIGGTPAQFGDHVEYYRKIYTDSGHSLDNLQLGVHSHTFVAASGSSLLSDYFPSYAAQMDRVGRSRGWPPYSRSQFEAGVSSHGALFMGEPKEVADKIIKVSKMFGLTRFIAHMDVGDPGHEAMKESIALFANEVVPAVKKALQGS